MSHNQGSAAIKKKPEESRASQTQIIPWPHLDDYLKPEKVEKPNWVKLDLHYLYYKGKKIPIEHFRKAGYGKLLKLLVKEIGG